MTNGSLTGPPAGPGPKFKPRRRTTLADVAAKAEVSVATVSKVLNSQPGISAKTRARVGSALRSLEYEPVRRPTEQRPSSTPSVAISFTTFGNNYGSMVLAGFMGEARTRGLHTTISHAPAPDPTEALEWVQHRVGEGAAGAVLVTTAMTDELARAAEEHGLALVAIDARSEGSATVPTIGATNWAGAATAAEHLIDLGHRRIAFAGLDSSADYAVERFSGYRSTLEQAGLQVEPQYVGRGQADFESGQRIGLEFARLDTPPTAVVAMCDAVALGLIEEARRQGISTPEQLSVVGFDNVQPAHWSTPRLTTINQPLAEMGRLGVRTLLDLMEGHPPASHHIQLATHLVARNSTRPLP